MASLEVENNQWGVIRNGEFEAQTNFVFEFKYHVNADLYEKSGYVVLLTRSSDGRTGTAWFCYKDIVSNTALIKSLNNSFATGRLFSSLKRQQITSLISSQASRISQSHVKRLVECLGVQQDGTLVLSPDLHINTDNEQLTQDESGYIWVPRWPSSPPAWQARNINLPVCMNGLKDFLQLVIEKYVNNAPQVVLSLASMVACGNYQHILETSGHFNIPLLTGPCMSGKTLAAICCAYIFGNSRQQIASRCTMASVTDQFKHSTLPWVWDDPRSLAQVQQVAEALGNGILPGNTGSLFTPRTACLITADSDFSQQLRVTNRLDPDQDQHFVGPELCPNCLQRSSAVAAAYKARENTIICNFRNCPRVFQIRFNNLQKIKRPGEGMELENSARVASSSLPLLLPMGQVSPEEILTEMKLIYESGIDHYGRQMKGMAVLLSICRKILAATGQSYFMSLILDYCNSSLHNQIS